ncbi:MAG: hypothetical protein M1838_003321 [Thelocarpon superellum]|nr:MAG: hypothetical protein M1838_003321 [Thelocarpon superellum]
MNAASLTSQRLRYLANSSAISTAEANMSVAERTKLAQSARRDIARRVKNDWRFIWVEDIAQSGIRAETNGSRGGARQDEDVAMDDAAITDRPAADNGLPKREDDVDEAAAEVDLPHVPRSYSSTSSTPSLSHSPSPPPGNHRHNHAHHYAAYEHGPVSPAYLYETPDAINAATITSRKARTRRQKRRKALEAEMKWNRALRHWVAQRDAWTGGVTRDLSMSNAASTPFSPSSAARASPEKDLTTLLPIHPPILPRTHPIRAPIGPATYTALYHKLVTKSLTPTVPINLADMTAAIVQGWKADDAWPPKPTEMEPSKC